MSKSRKLDLDLGIYPAKFLLNNGQLDDVQELLCEFAPSWSEKARVWNSRTDQERINLQRPGSIEEIFRKFEAERTKRRKLREQRLGPSPYPRFLGSIELRSATDALTVIISVDEYVISPMGGEWLFGNDVVFQVRQSRIERQDAVEWTFRVFEAISDRISPLYGHVYTCEEYEHKNISREDGGVEAVGRDVSKHLPGLYCLNFLGKPYCDLIKLDKLLSTPAPDVRRVDNGVLLRLSDNPRKWSTPDYQIVERGVLDHIGHKYFYSKEAPNRPTIAPSFDIFQSPLTDD